MADIGLHAHGYRSLTSRPGHHQVAIQSLSKSLGIAATTVIVLDNLRKQRHLIEYVGESVPESMVDACISEAENLLTRAVSWLEANRPELL